MSEETASARTRRIAFVFSGLVDAIIGAALLLIWVGFLPVDPTEFGIPRWIVGVMGGLLFFPGFTLVAYLMTKPRPPG